MIGARARLVARLAGCCCGLAIGPTAGLEPSLPMTDDKWLAKTRALREHWQATGSPAHFRVFDADGRSCQLDQVLAGMASADVVCVGETHDDPVAHQLEAFLAIEASRAARARGAQRVVLSLEMFESDVQPVLDEYTLGLIRPTDLMHDARPWGNYRHDYGPLVEMARDSGLELLAANAPRRYVAAVARGGKEALEGFPADAMQFLAPLPCPEPSKEYLDHFRAEMLPAQHEPAELGAAAGAAVEGEVCPYISFKANDKSMIDPVVLWDATMAHRIAERLNGSAQGFLLHFCGSFHCQRRLGIVEMLKHYNPALRVLVVVIYPEEYYEQFNQLEHAGKGDYVILTNEKIPRSAQKC